MSTMYDLQTQKVNSQPKNIDKEYCMDCENYWSGDLNKCDGCRPTYQNTPTKFKELKSEKEEKKMVVTIIGSLKKSDKMEECKKFFEAQGCKVYSPANREVQFQPLINIQGQWIKNIDAADLIVAIPKEKLLDQTAGVTRYVNEFGESTSYEMAIAISKRKPIMTWD